MADAVPLVDVRAAYLAQRAELDAAVAEVVGRAGSSWGRRWPRSRRPSRASAAPGGRSAWPRERPRSTWPWPRSGSGRATRWPPWPTPSPPRPRRSSTPGPGRGSWTSTRPPAAWTPALAGAVEGTAAVLPVHLYGLPVDMPAISPLPQMPGCRLVEDAAQAHGATLTGADGRVRRAVSAGRLAASASTRARTLARSATPARSPRDDDELADRVRRLRDHGRTTKYEHAEVGCGERLDALQAAVLRVKLERLEAGNAARERLAGRYDEALAGVGDLVPPARVEGRTSARHLHVVRTRHRDELLAACRAAGVGAGPLPGPAAPPAGLAPPRPGPRRPAGHRGLGGRVPVAAAVPGADRGPAGPGGRGRPAVLRRPPSPAAPVSGRGAEVVLRRRANR